MGTGKFPESINEGYQKYVRYILKELGKTEEEFIKDVDKAIEDMNEYFSQDCNYEESL